MHGWTLGMLVCAGFASAVCAQEVPRPISGQRPSASTAWVALPVQAQVPPAVSGLRPLGAVPSSVPALAPSFPLVEVGQPAALPPALREVGLLAPVPPQGQLALSSVVEDVRPSRALAAEVSVALGGVAPVRSSALGMRPSEMAVFSQPVLAPAYPLAEAEGSVDLPPSLNVAALLAPVAPQGQLAPSDVVAEPRPVRAVATEVSVAMGDVAEVYVRPAEMAGLSSHPSPVATFVPATVGPVATLPLLAEAPVWAEVSGSNTVPLPVPPSVVGMSKSGVPSAASSVLAPLAPALDAPAPAPRVALTWEQRLEPRAVPMER